MRRTALLPPSQSRGNQSSTLCLEDAARFVSRIVVYRGHVLASESKEDAELRAVMDHVVEEVGAKHEVARLAEERLPRGEQRPWLGELLVARLAQCRAQIGDVLVEETQQRGTRTRDLLLRRRRPRRHHV